MVQVAPRRDTDVDQSEALVVLERLERYIAQHPGPAAPARVWDIAHRRVDDDNDSIGLILAASAQPAALACCLAVIFAFEQLSHGIAAALALVAVGGTGYAISRRIPLAIACTVGILAGLAIALLS